VWRSPPVWPPDAFGVCAYVLRKSGAYTAIAAGWPPSSAPGLSWSKWINGIGLKWRDDSVRSNRVPPEVQAWWNVLVAGITTPLRDLGMPAHRSVAEALLQLSAAADEACEGIGMPGDRTDLFD